MVKLPPYRLQTLFQMRDKAKKEAEEAFALAQKAHLTEQRKLDEMKAELAAKVEYRETRHREYTDKAASGALNIHAITSGQRHIERLKEEEAAFEVEIDKQRERVEEAEQELDEKRRLMVEATRDFKSLEKHKEKWVKAIRKEQDYKEEIVSEDVAQTIYLNKNKK